MKGKQDVIIVLKMNLGLQLRGGLNQKLGNFWNV